MNTGGPASEKTLLDEFAGQALAAMVEAESKESHKQLTNDGYGSEETYFTSGFADEDYWDGAAKASYACASAMLAEKARREATGKDSLQVQTREVDDDRWAKFQDGIRIVFQPTNGWCAEIREGSMGYGNTIAEAVANLRARWEERSAAPVVQQPSTTDDAGKMAELQAANRELVEALEVVLKMLKEWHCDFRHEVGDKEEDATQRAQSLIAKHKGAA